MKKGNGKAGKPLKRKVGRPSIFDEVVAKKIIEMAGEGKTDKQIAEMLGVTPQTILNWKKGDREFFWSLKDAKALADQAVEASLYHRASGYSHPEEKIHVDKGVVTKVDTIKHYPPDAASAIFWLKNRQPDKWRDRIEHKIESEGTLFVNTGDGIEEFDL